MEMQEKIETKKKTVCPMSHARGHCGTHASKDRRIDGWVGSRHNERWNITFFDEIASHIADAYDRGRAQHL